MCRRWFFQNLWYSKLIVFVSHTIIIEYFFRNEREMMEKNELTRSSPVNEMKFNRAQSDAKFMVHMSMVPINLFHILEHVNICCVLRAVAVFIKIYMTNGIVALRTVDIYILFCLNYRKKSLINYSNRLQTAHDLCVNWYWH